MLRKGNLQNPYITPLQSAFESIFASSQKLYKSGFYSEMRRWRKCPFKLSERMSECALLEKFSWTAKKVQFSGEIQTQETGIDNGFYLNQGGIDVIRNCCFLKINVARFARKSDLKMWVQIIADWNMIKGRENFPHSVEVCEGESIKKQRRESTRRELFFYEFTMLEIL